MNNGTFTICASFAGENLAAIERSLNSLTTAIRDGQQIVQDFRLLLCDPSNKLTAFVHAWAWNMWYDNQVPSVILSSDERVPQNTLLWAALHETPLDLAEYVLWMKSPVFLETKAGWWSKLAETMQRDDMVGSVTFRAVSDADWAFVETLPWHREEAGLPPTVQEGRKFRHCRGHWWTIRSSILTRFKWPPRDVDGAEDWLLGELLRQNGFTIGTWQNGIRGEVRQEDEELAVKTDEVVEQVASEAISRVSIPRETTNEPDMSPCNESEACDER